MKTARAVAVCLAFVAAGCASQDAHPRNAVRLSSVGPSSSVSPSSSANPSTSAPVVAPSGYPPPAHVGVLATPSHDPVAEVDLAVPLATDVPRISFTQAYAAGAPWGPGGTPTKGPTITLALVTSPQTGQQNADGSLTPLMNRSLTYVLTWDGLPCGAPAGPASYDPTRLCTYGTFVDANTGQDMFSYDG